VRQIKDFPELNTPSNTDIILVQSDDGITQHIKRSNFLAGATESSGSALPKSFSHWHDESIIEVGGSISIDINTSLLYGVEIYQNPAAIGDSFCFYRILEAGNYRISVLTVKTASVGKFKLEIDGNLAFDDLDLYSPSVQPNSILNRDIVISSAGMHKFKWTVYTKNPSATNYYFSGRKIWGVKI
jgi:hypothetical protein